MLELLELILSSLDFSANNSNGSTIDTISPNTECEPKVFVATSPSGGEKGKQGLPSQSTESKKPKGDPAICKKLTELVIEAHKKSKLNPITSAEHVDEEGRKHIAVAGGAKLPIIGDKTFSGCVSFPAPAPGDNKKK